MTKPLAVELIPLRAAIRSDAPTTVDVLIRLTPPQTETTGARPKLNLGLVIDRSGSMSGNRKIDYARAAATFAVQQLLNDDRVSLTIFDDRIETPYPNATVTDKARLFAAIERIQPRGSTDLHGGWAEGAKQTRDHLVAGGLNRVLVLSDGLANVGVVNQDAIATAVNEAARAGVSATTLGLGDDYNEDLLEAMARSGDGNYYYIEHPTQLPTVFANELMGLVASFGTSATLSLESLVNSSGDATKGSVDGVEILNDTERLADGRWQLPNLIAGMPVSTIARFHVPPQSPGTHAIAKIVIEWLPTNASEREQFVATLALPAVSGSAYEMLAPNLDVHERVVLLSIARLKKESTSLLQNGDKSGAIARIAEARAILSSAPPTDEVRRESEAITDLENDIAMGDDMKFTKRAKYQSYQRSHSRPV